MKKTEILSPDDALAADVVYLLRELLHALLISSVPTWIDLQLTLPQLRTIFTIAHHKSSSIVQISRHLGVGEPTTSYLVDKLVNAGLVERKQDAEDRRRLVVTLSPEGGELVEKLFGWEELLGASLHQISRENLSSLRQGLKAVMDRLPTETQPDNTIPHSTDQETTL